MRLLATVVVYAGASAWIPASGSAKVSNDTAYRGGDGVAVDTAASGKATQLVVLAGTDPRKSPMAKVSVFTDDGKNGSWAPAVAIGSMGSSGRAASLDGSLYFVGGTCTTAPCRELSPGYPYLNHTLKLAPGARKWERVAGIPFAVTDPKDAPIGAGVASHALVALGEHVYSVGGTNGTASLDALWRYTPKTDTWKQMQSMRVRRCYVAVTVYDGKIYAIGGSTTPAGPGGGSALGPGAVTSAEVYDVEADSWTLLKAQMKVARSTLAAATLGKHIYAVGGENGGAVSVSFASVERLDVSDPEAAWEQIANMTMPRCQVGAGVLGNALFAVGGYNDKTDLSWLRSVERYDSASDSWRAVAPFLEERQYIAVTVL